MIPILKIIGLLSIFTNAHSQALVGGVRDDHSCLIGAGYTWCESSNSCIRQWETPCSDNWSDCEDCLLQQRKGINIACPQDCDMIAVDPMPPVAIDPMPPVVIDPLPPPPPSPPSPSSCSEVMCMMYCENGHKLDVNGCPICECNDDNIHLPVPISSPIPSPTPYPLPDTESSSNSACLITQLSCDSYTYLCPKIVEMTSCGEGGIDGHTTYQLSVILNDNLNIRNVYALFGDEKQSSEFTIPPAYQSEISINNNLGGISDSLSGSFPDLEWDSWLTIGLTNGDLDNTLGSVGVPFGSWTEDSGIDVLNGAVFVMDPEFDSPIGEEIVIAQLTIPNDLPSGADFVVSVQGKTIDQRIEKSWTEPNVRFHLSSINPLTDCISWYDGCNTCRVNNGRLGGCTRMMCFREDTPRCLQFASSDSSDISGH